jgi:hypothetical protein
MAAAAVTSFVDAETRESARNLEAWVGSKDRREKPKTIADAQWRKAREWAEGAMRDGDWSEALPRHFVAAYELLHERTYGVAPAELTPAVRLQAAGLAAAMLRKEFDDDPEEMAEFLRWTWNQEAKTEKWRRANNRDGRRIGFRLQFTGALLTDYRISKKRRAGAR